MSNININPNMSASDQVEAIGRQYQLKLWSEIERVGLTSCPYTDSTNAICLDDSKVDTLRKALGITERGAPVHAELPTVRKDASPIERVWVFTGKEEDVRTSVMSQMDGGIVADKPELSIISLEPDDYPPKNFIGCYPHGIFAPVTGYTEEQLQYLLDNILDSLDNAISNNEYFLIGVSNIDLIHPLIRMRVGSVFHCSRASEESENVWVVNLDALTNESRRYVMTVSKKETVNDESRLPTRHKSGDDDLDRSKSKHIPLESSSLDEDEKDDILSSGSERDRAKLSRHLGRKRFGRGSAGASPELAADESSTVDETGTD